MGISKIKHFYLPAPAASYDSSLPLLFFFFSFWFLVFNFFLRPAIRGSSLFQICDKVVPHTLTDRINFSFSLFTYHFPGGQRRMAASKTYNIGSGVGGKGPRMKENNSNVKTKPFKESPF